MCNSLQTSFSGIMKDWPDKYHVWGTPRNLCAVPVAETWLNADIGCTLCQAFCAFEQIGLAKATSVMEELPYPSTSAGAHRRNNPSPMPKTTLKQSPNVQD